MKQNVGSKERIARALAGLLALTCSVMAPLPLLARIGAFGTLGVYLLFTAASGHCLGARLLGRRSDVEPGR